MLADILSKFSGMLEGLRKFGDVLINAFTKVKQVFMVVCELLYLLTYLLISASVRVIMCLHLCASVTKQYNLVPAKRVISFAGKVAVGLVESNDSLTPGL